MTTFALIAGMLPIALGTGEGSAFRAPMGVAIVGGVITSTFLTLLVIPTFYEIIDLIRSKLSHRVGLRAPQTAEHPVVTAVETNGSRPALCAAAENRPAHGTGPRTALS